MLKRNVSLMEAGADGQSPLGGCVLKRISEQAVLFGVLPVAFRRLCVETLFPERFVWFPNQSPLGGCVLKR